MKTLSGQTEREPSPSVETYWVVDVFGQNDKVKRKSRRPPTFNPEDYVVFLRKVLTSTNPNGGIYTAVEKLYGKDAQMSAEMRSKLSHNVTASAGDKETNNRTNNKQSSDVSDIIKKLRLDLFFSFASFCKEFVGETCDGIALLMDLLRTIQMAQAELNGSNKELSNVRANRRSLIRNASTDELEVLLSLYQLCLANGHVPGKDHGLSRLLAHNAGFYGLALALVSNLTRTRSLALQLMTALCKMPGGHSRVSEALTTLRLNMGESVRLKLLSGIVNSTASRVESLIGSSKDSINSAGDIANNTDSSLRFLVESMAFLNAFVQSASDLRNQVVIQWEVEEAALNVHALSQVADTVRSPLAAQLRQELSAWGENQINITLLLDRLTNVTSTNEALRKDLLSLRSRLLALENEKRRFSELENDMKKRCADLETELTTLRTSHPITTSSSSVGIQATELRMDEKLDDEHYTDDWYPKAGSQMSFDDEDYDIDDVIEELNNIVNSAESDMNTEKNSSNSGGTPKDSGSFTEEHLVPKYLPRPPPRPDSKRSFAPSPPAVHLDADLNGETSDFPMATVISVTPDSNHGSSDSEMERGPTEISRKKITQSFFRQSDMEEEDDDDKAFDSSVCESDWGKTQILRRNIRKSFRSAEGSSRGMSIDEMTEEKIQPDILRAIPTRLFHKSWDVLEARSPIYADDMVISSSGQMHNGPILLSSRRRHASVDNLSNMQRESPIFIHPMVHHPNLRDRSTDEMLMYEQQQQRFLMGHSPMPHHVYRHPEHFHDPNSPIDSAAHLGDLQIGDVFSFPGQYSGHSSRTSARTENGGSRKNKRHVETDGFTGSKPGSRNSFAFANLIPGFIKSSFGSSKDSSSKSSKEEWETFHSEKTLMKDYRQHFQPHQSIPPVVLRHPNEHHFDINPAEFWPPSFQAMPFRNIPQQISNMDPNRSQKTRSIRVSSPNQMSRTVHNNVNRVAKLMDHPSGMY